MYICKPERNALQAKLLIAICALVTIALFAASSLIAQYSSLLNFAGVAALAVSILLVVRYYMTEFEYSVDSESFSIVKTVGTRKQTVCCLALDKSCELIKMSDYKLLPRDKKAIIKYSLNQNIKAESYVFLCDFNGKRTMVEFEPNAEFVVIVERMIANAVNAEEDSQ
ncbi:MAG: hypothetical protein IJO64_02555 [Clostridia bacterium]|nr:hypothetical protein [Clostridia bacterium]